MSFFRKIFLFLALFFLFSLILAAGVKGKEQVATPAPEEINSFELFWPIVAGKTEGDSLYQLKLFKENLREFLIPSSIKKADYNIVLSEKRLVEAEKLLMSSRIDLAKKTLEKATFRRQKALSLYEKAKNSGAGISDLSAHFITSFEKQRSLLLYLSSKTQEEGKPLVISSLENLNFILSQLQ